MRRNARIYTHMLYWRPWTPPPFVKKKKEPKAYFMGTPTDGTCRDGKRAAVPNVRQGPAHGGRTSPAPLAYLAHLNNYY